MIANNMKYNDEMIYQMLDQIRMRPAMWLGSLNISTLRTYIEGYHHALIDLELNKNKTKTALFPLDFWFMHEFSKIKTNSYESTSGWANLILKKCDGDQKAALEQFYKYLDEFRSLKAVSIKKAILTEENILANDNMIYSCRIGSPIDISQMDITDNEDLYFRSGSYIGRKFPIYDSPKAVYIIELSNDIGFLSAVETENDIQLERYIFRKNEIFGNDKSSHSPEYVFGALTTFTDVSCVDNPDFDKAIY